jgi:hypothetical protein
MSDLVEISHHMSARDTAAASQFLRQSGVPVAPTTLRKLRCIGGGPAFYKALGRVLYEERALIEWAQSKRSPEVNSTSELPLRRLGHAA